MVQRATHLQLLLFVILGGSKTHTPVSSNLNVDTSVSSNLKAFSYSDLKTAAKNFRSETLLGEGGFGCVFKGWLDENTLAPTKPGTGIVVAIKRLAAESFQGHKEWLVCTPIYKFYFLFFV